MQNRWPSVWSVNFNKGNCVYAILVEIWRGGDRGVIVVK